MDSNRSQSSNVSDSACTSVRRLRARSEDHRNLPRIRYDIIRIKQTQPIELRLEEKQLQHSPFDLQQKRLKFVSDGLYSGASASLLASSQQVQMSVEKELIFPIYIVQPGKQSLANGACTGTPKKRLV